MRFIIKGGELENPDGSFTSRALAILEDYARSWIEGRRDLEAERKYPDLVGTFYDIRVDPEYAREHATPADPELEKAMNRALGPTEKFLVKAKYISRTRGPDGKYRYVYPDDGKKARKQARQVLSVVSQRHRVKTPVTYQGRTTTKREPWHSATTPVARHWVDRIPGEPMGLAAPGGDDGGTFAKYGGSRVTGEVTDPERKRLHDQIMEKFLGDTRPVAPGDQKYAVVMMGGPASGKSTATRGMNLDDFVKVDPDAVKSELPEMQRGLNLGRAPDGTVITARSTAAAVHEESSYLADRIRDRAVATNRHVLIDGTGINADRHERLIKSLQDKGYRVKLVFAHQSLDTAKELNRARATTSGRYVPDAVLEGSYAKIPHNFERLAAVADSASMFDASRGHPPKKIVTIDRGPPRREVPDDVEFWKKFRSEYGPGQGKKK